MYDNSTMVAARRRVALCSSFTPSIVCVTERVTREHGIVPDGAADAPAAPDAVADVWDSHANVLRNQGCDVMCGRESHTAW